MFIAKLKRRLFKYLWLVRPVFYILLTALVLGLLYLSAPLAINLTKRLIQIPVAVVSVFNPRLTSLDSFRSRTNILLLGVGGGDHPGADLTDSIMLISTHIDSGDTVLLSLPRDIWVESLKGKLNSIYRLGESKKPGAGLTLVKSAASEIINQPIHSAVLLDFSGFEKAIDVIGGITVNIPRGFLDPKYPIPGKETVQPESERYQNLTFEAGIQHMDGATALKYVRSRHAEGEEGTDYARSQRQQRVALALKDKLLSVKILFNPSQLRQLYKIFTESVITDLSSKTYPDIFKLILRADKDNIRTGILDQGSEIEEIPPLLYNPPISLYGQWILLPINNDWQSIHTYVEELLYQNQ